MRKRGQQSTLGTVGYAIIILILIVVGVAIIQWVIIAKEDVTQCAGYLQFGGEKQGLCKDSCGAGEYRLRAFAGCPSDEVCCVAQAECGPDNECQDDGFECVGGQCQRSSEAGDATGADESGDNADTSAVRTCDEDQDCDQYGEDLVCTGGTCTGAPQEPQHELASLNQEQCEQQGARYYQDKGCYDEERCREEGGMWTVEDHCTLKCQDASDLETGTLYEDRNAYLQQQLQEHTSYTPQSCEHSCGPTRDSDADPENNCFAAAKHCPETQRFGFTITNDEVNGDYEYCMNTESRGTARVSGSAASVWASILDSAKDDVEELEKLDEVVDLSELAEAQSSRSTELTDYCASTCTLMEATVDCRGVSSVHYVPVHCPNGCVKGRCVS